MKKLFALFLLTISSAAFTQMAPFSHPADNNALPVSGFCIAAPDSKDLDRFISFINEELAPRKVNTLVLRVDYNFQYQTHPELSSENALSLAEVKKLLAACRLNNITLIPLFDLLGHQSWANREGNLLKTYPEFDETPGVKMPEKYEWPNADKLYCKSYCPLHPGVHKVVFELMDELCDAFETNAFHAGMDEVFYIGESQCPRCSGKDKSVLFADEVTAIHDHLAAKGRKLWIWGDRLIDGKTTGIGEWEASENDTYRAIDRIPRDITICDWHYERPDQTAVYFAMKGFNVVTCPYNKMETAILQAQDMFRFRKNSSPEMRDRFMGMVQTEWSDCGNFLDKYYDTTGDKNSSVKCFMALFDEISKQSATK